MNKKIWKGEMNVDMEVNEKNMTLNNMDDEMMEERNRGRLKLGDEKDNNEKWETRCGSRKK